MSEWKPHDVVHDNLATHAELMAEISLFRTELKAEFAELRTDLKSGIAGVRADIELAKRDLKIWFGWAMVAWVGVILAAIRYLPPGHP